MADAPPRLDPTTGTAPGYAPISWTAVASLAVAGFFVLLLAALAVIAVTRKQPLIEPWLLAFPALAVVLAFTARRQIDNADGTRTGVQYATAGWWVGVLAGLGYVMYLFGVEVAIRNDAQREFRAFAQLVADIDPANPKDPNFYEAVLRTVPPGQRGQVRGGGKDPAAVDRVFREEVIRARQIDLLRVAGRNKGKVTFSNFGVQDWTQAPNKLSCTLTCTMETPEGQHRLVVPMQATVDKGARSWQVNAPAAGFVRDKALTRYGWVVEQLEASGQGFAVQFLTTLSLPEQQPAAFAAFVAADGVPADAARVLGSGPGRAAVLGSPSFLPPRPPGYEDAVPKLFALADGAAPPPTELARFVDCWNNGRIQGAGFALRDTPDANAVLRFTPTGAEMLFPIELRLSANATGAARGKLVLRADDPALPAELAKFRDEPLKTFDKPPAELLSKLPTWRVVRIESDLRVVQPAPPPPPPGGGGFPG